MNLTKFDEIIGRDVNENVRNMDSRYEAERNLLVSELSEIGFLDAVAIHEAGHEHYYREAGGSDFSFVPPLILFRKDNMLKPFKKQIARIEVGKYESNQQESNWFLKLAKGYAAD